MRMRGPMLKATGAQVAQRTCRSVKITFVVRYSLFAQFMDRQRCVFVVIIGSVHV